MKLSPFLAPLQTLLLSKAELQGAYAPIRHELEILKAFPSGFALVRDLGAPPPARVVYRGQLVENFDPGQLTEKSPTAIEGLPISDAGDAERYTAAAKFDIDSVSCGAAPASGFFQGDRM